MFFGLEKLSPMPFSATRVNLNQTPLHFLPFCGNCTKLWILCLVEWEILPRSKLCHFVQLDIQLFIYSGYLLFVCKVLFHFHIPSQAAASIEIQNFGGSFFCQKYSCTRSLVSWLWYSACGGCFCGLACVLGDRMHI